MGDDGCDGIAADRTGDRFYNNWNMETRVCKRCGRELPLDKFRKNLHGYTHVCRECVMLKLDRRDICLHCRYGSFCRNENGRVEPFGYCMKRSKNIRCDGNCIHWQAERERKIFVK